ncbi:MAG: protoporphyrinogen oxidase HemJ [Beijerinckiaceae bacterium]|nr:protoporphyrinogen oxidase HemJ [Beijerinckiaceae bacterium]
MDAAWYLWLKALHIIAVVAWMAGMLYLPRLFVYHAGVSKGTPQAALFEVMEYRLQRYIMLPALLVTWASGLTLAIQGAWVKAGWLHSKLFLVLLLTGVHGYLALERKRLAEGTSERDAKFFRILNEVPTLLLIGIVILVVVKPF